MNTHNVCIYVYTLYMYTLCILKSIYKVLRENGDNSDKEKLGEPITSRPVLQETLNEGLWMKVKWYQ